MCHKLYTLYTCNVKVFMKRFPIGYQSDRVRYSSVSYGGVKKHLNFFQRFRQHLRNATRRNVTNGVIVVFNGFSCYEKLMRKKKFQNIFEIPSRNFTTCC